MMLQDGPEEAQELRREEDVVDPAVLDVAHALVVAGRTGHGPDGPDGTDGPDQTTDRTDRTYI